ncbi:PREDICTED: putative RNA polymerase II subunit B1 CTD phosphatase RPAP2 homolog [Bactrocera latifrons]|uniref:RNA polymerase II subunit B1 CTD phosphatase RPAP2 homolog n=1 Tax=Bactrocera latifrons TaxID=174628 RepID=A0A0K8UAW4_BACLA|nr:PREDICTED: putative RNA polymerase II subunit B1 CTD phosphatase RPAP2 homolog [Bactrocera latifrons]
MQKSNRNRLSEEQLLKAIQKKKECNAKAQKIVESFLERNITRDYFLSQLKDINQCHYEDIVDERHILLICGYPLCENLLEKVPSKKYQISTTINKVYDITDRKKFCSSQCFKASEFIKSQILVSPLWLRQNEQIPEFKLLIEKNTGT